MDVTLNTAKYVSRNPQGWISEDFEPKHFNKTPHELCVWYSHLSLVVNKNTDKDFLIISL